MLNKKVSLILKALLIVIFVCYILYMPTADGYRKWLRLGLLIFFTVTFILELIKYRKDNA
jgi:hypothetical protein